MGSRDFSLRKPMWRATFDINYIINRITLNQPTIGKLICNASIPVNQISSFLELLKELLKVF